MATINLGNIKFKWQGAYNGATAYTVDDVVSYNGSSYICIANSTGNLPTDTSYFEQMSSAGTNGTNGTDLTTTLTTQGDLVYRDGSGLQRLGAGTAGQVLQTGGTGANPSWGTLSSDWVKLASVDQMSSAVTSIDVDGYFSSTYRNYKIFLEAYDHQSNIQIGFQWLQSGTPITTNYNCVNLYYNRPDVVGRNSRNNEASFNLTGYDNQGGNSDFPALYEIALFSPAETTRYKGYTCHASYYTSTSTPCVDVSGGYCTNTTGAMTGVRIKQDGSSTTQSFKARVSLYGLKV